MPYEANECGTEEFKLQLAIIHDIIERNSDHLVIWGGDFNANFNQDWPHTVWLTGFSTNLSLYTFVNHGRLPDFLYNFNMQCLDQVIYFIISEALFTQAVCELYWHDVEKWVSTLR